MRDDSDKIDVIYDSLQNRNDVVLFSCFNLLNDLHYMFLKKGIKLRHPTTVSS